MAHPYLAPAATVVGAWLGRVSFHGGGIEVGGRAWLVLADAMAGKSSLLACLAVRGTPVLADDLLVVRGSRVFAGPRCIDLRADSAAALGVGEALGMMGGRERWRVALGRVKPECELGGFVVLCWGSKIDMIPVPLRRRIEVLHRHLAVIKAESDSKTLLALSVLPMFGLVRPRRVESLGESTDRLLATILATRWPGDPVSAVRPTR